MQTKWTLEKKESIGWIITPKLLKVLDEHTYVYTLLFGFLKFEILNVEKWSWMHTNNACPWKGLDEFERGVKLETLLW